MEPVLFMLLCIKYIFILSTNHDGLSRCDISHRDAPNGGWLQLQTSLATRRTQANIASILEHSMQNPSKYKSCKCSRSWHYQHYEMHLDKVNNSQSEAIKRKKNKGYATGEVVRSRSEWIKHCSLWPPGQTPSSTAE